MTDKRRNASNEAENHPKLQLNRRRLLKLMGAAGVTAVVTPYLPSLLGKNATLEAEGHVSKKRLRRWVMVIDLRKCDGCVSIGKAPQCTEACIQQRSVPEGMQFIEVYQYELAGGGTQFIPMPCMQCQNAPCVNVCPVGATFSTPEGVILIDQERCIGCRLCMAACPYQRRFFNWGEPVIPAQAHFAEYNVESQIPAKRGTVMKCDFCPDRPRNGALPYCIEGCPNRAVYYGDEEEDVATNGRKVVKLSKFLSDNQAYRLKEELGTKPSVYYIPGHGQDVGRDPFDTRDLEPVTWPWSNDGENDGSTV
ncbi:MAG: 4Fe-4S dicluster domain-containing protein [Dehalococcoidia bacterium]